ncbi:MAG: hypothetical protein Q8M09_04155 [Pseudomonadota bacterium]|nr:hypothetical protein [Pseudomonadota bacterium]MDP1903432.1 hypothetical protein [Pseudomonadota bacterium]MDP2351591.1 hypothetical protein [Pseudomonadota bacterium]
MSFPEFFTQIPALTLHDGLAEVLGAAAGGVIEYHYEDVVRLAGHSCPTVAGAWLLARHGLAALYPEGMPERGGIRVELCAAQDAGTTGVVGAVLGLITGAAGEGGFKGLGPRFGRRELLQFGVEMPAEVRFTRLDNGAAVQLEYHPEAVPPAAGMQTLMPRVVSGQADAFERAEFARLWQERVQRILLDHADDPAVVKTTA